MFRPPNPLSGEWSGTRALRWLQPRRPWFAYVATAQNCVTRSPPGSYLQSSGEGVSTSSCRTGIVLSPLGRCRRTLEGGRPWLTYHVPGRVVHDPRMHPHHRRTHFFTPDFLSVVEHLEPMIRRLSGDSDEVRDLPRARWCQPIDCLLDLSLIGHAVAASRLHGQRPHPSSLNGELLGTVPNDRRD